MKYMRTTLFTTIILLVGISGCTDTGNDHTEEIPEIIGAEEDDGRQIDNIAVSSIAFEQNGEIPSRYACDGENINPELMLGNLPINTETLALIVDDPDAPTGTFTHWVVWNIEPAAVIHENTNPGVQGLNDFKMADYSGPCPPSGTHRYFFRVYALNTTLEIPPGSERTILEQEMQGHIIAEGELIGTYSRI